MINRHFHVGGHDRRREKPRKSVSARDFFVIVKILISVEIDSGKEILFSFCDLIELKEVFE